MTGRSSASKSDGRKLEDQYEYRDKDGKLLYVKKRWRLPSGEKTFSYHHPGPDGRLLPGLGGSKTVLYNLPAIATAAPGSVVYIVEGEKDVNRLKKVLKLRFLTPPDQITARYSLGCDCRSCLASTFRPVGVSIFSASSFSSRCSAS